jgi:hypothetical protein
MGRFLYFLPGMTGLPQRADVLRDFPGLDYAFPAGAQFNVCTTSGPKNIGGVLAAAGDGHGLRYLETEQEWQPITAIVGPVGSDPESMEAGAHGQPWIGWDRKAKPLPEDLQREGMSLDGKPVLLADGHNWTVPIVRLINGDTRLPCVLGLDAKGRVTKRVRPEYQVLFALAGNIFDAEASLAVEHGHGIEDLYVLGTLALQVNYRIGSDEVSILGLLDTENVKKIADVLLDGENLRKLLEEWRSKKNAGTAPGANSATGAADVAATSQPTEK